MFIYSFNRDLLCLHFMQEIKQANRRHDPPVLKHTVHWAVTTNSTCMTIARYMLHRKSVHWIFGFREMWKLRSGGWFRTCQGKRGGGFQTEGTEFVEAWKQEKTWRRFYKYVYMGGGYLSSMLIFSRAALEVPLGTASQSQVGCMKPAGCGLLLSIQDSYLTTLW